MYKEGLASVKKESQERNLFYCQNQFSQTKNLRGILSIKWTESRPNQLLWLKYKQLQRKSNVVVFEFLQSP